MALPPGESVYQAIPAGSHSPTTIRSHELARRATSVVNAPVHSAIATPVQWEVQDELALLRIF